ncbi:hypothetical protein RRG08_059494 [Elysia crispata]|uniref:Uncharacterized protein n=1 Tax=Elysia crispata TaxID=231223 RepID=A0AAE0Z6T1_9GAST|nr:hypothetical protein RRG08_059494 [Elysia crispata]
MTSLTPHTTGPDHSPISSAEFVNSFKQAKLQLTCQCAWPHHSISTSGICEKKTSSPSTLAPLLAHNCTTAPTPLLKHIHKDGYERLLSSTVDHLIALTRSSKRLQVVQKCGLNKRCPRLHN